MTPSAARGIAALPARRPEPRRRAPETARTLCATTTGAAA